MTAKTTLQTNLLRNKTKTATIDEVNTIISSMKQLQEQINQKSIHSPWYKDRQVIVTIIVGVISAAATVIAALL